MKFSQNKLINGAFWLILGLSVQACALMDIKPKAGFPDTISTSKESPSLLPSDAYNFHENPRL